MKKYSHRRYLPSATVARSQRALLAVVVTAGVTFHATGVTQAQDNPPAAQATSDVESAESYLASLVSESAAAEREAAAVENELGGLRENANKARVDLAKAQEEAQAAQDKVLDARSRLEKSDEELSHAQTKLDDVARAAYNRGGDAAPINLAAGGGNAVADTLDRSTYIRLATEKQRSEVERLDLARTQSANEEAALRSSRSEADSAVARAFSAHATAQDALTAAQTALADAQQRYAAVQGKKDAAQARLEAARKAVDALKAGASSFEKRRAAEAAVAAVDNGGAAAAPATPAAEPKAEEALPASASENADAPNQNTPNESTANAGAPSESAANADAGTQDAVEPAGGDHPTEAADATAAADGVVTTPYAGTEDGAAGSTGNAQGSAEQLASLGDLGDLPQAFAGSSEGDAQRQMAIDGLLAAGGAAAMAGFGTYAHSEDQDAAMRAALEAARNTARQRYDAAQTELGGQINTEEIGGDPVSTVDDAQSQLDSLAGALSGGTSAGTALPGGIGAAVDSTVDTSGTAEEKIERVIERARSQMGVTYAWGGGNHYGPTLGIRDGGVADSYGDYAKVGFDCSGLMMYAFHAVGIKLEHYSGYQYTSGRQIPASQAKRGDMLFWGAGGSQHVALYLGDGTMIEAPQSGDVVKISPVRWAGMTPMAVRLIE